MQPITLKSLMREVVGEASLPQGKVSSPEIDQICSRLRALMRGRRNFNDSDITAVLDSLKFMLVRDDWKKGHASLTGP